MTDESTTTEKSKPKKVDETIAQRQEALGTYTVEYDGDTYTFPVERFTIDVVELDEEQKYVTFVRELLGPEQWALYKERHPLASEIMLMRAAIVAALGNPSASSDS